MSEDIQVLYEATPNPQSMKFVVTKQICDESVQFNDQASAIRSPLAQKVFGFPWTEAIFLGPNFITVTKQEWVEWNILAEPLSQLIKEHIESGEAVLNANTEPEPTESDPSNDSDVVKQIKEILNNEIRPAVAMDGGDIVFHKYEDHILYLHMQGACAGCPSSTVTLKMGIESRMKELLPEIQEVVSI